MTQQWDDASLVGLAILERDGEYNRNLALARMGVLPFFWIACVTVYLWARRYLGEPSAAFAVFFFTLLPPVLAHAGLATTDMALTAFVGASFLMSMIWIERQTRVNTVLLGIIVGLAVLSKFSSLPYLPVALAAAFVWHIIAKRRATNSLPARRYLAPLGVAALICCVVVWAGYRFSFGPVEFTKVHRVIRLPAPEFFNGLQNLARYNKYGHGTFLLGRYSTVGFWYFFPVVLAVKTPIPFLLLTLFGAVATTRRKTGVWLALAFSLGILLFTLISHLNFGVRHILPVYIGFSIVAAAGAERLLEFSARMRWTGWLLGALVLWMSVTSVMSHPDYLAYFNELAGGKPEKLLVDSDLDWGQDLKRLGERLKQVHADSVSFTPYDPADLKALGYPAVSPLNEAGPTAGWNAVSLTGSSCRRGTATIRMLLPGKRRWCRGRKSEKGSGYGIFHQVRRKP